MSPPSQPPTPDPSSRFVCPTDHVRQDRTSYWTKPHNTCSFCGSMNPNTFMCSIQSPDFELVPTDKDYKVYIRSASMPQDKFYFQHLSEAQRLQFVDLLNQKKIRIAYPGYFYRLPFFMRVVSA